MTKIEIRKAERQKSKLRLAIAGPSGSGKTFSSLKLAFGLGGRVGMLDTENGSGDLYANLGEYDIITIRAPYTAQKYLDAIKAFEDGKYDTIICDSLSHAWSGEGGLLDKQGKIADRTGNSWAAWRTITPEHNALVEAILQSPCHIIATMRSKQEYVQDRDEKNGKTVIRKVGMAPVMRDGVEYEFTVFFDLAMDHTGQSSKDRTRLFDGQIFKVDENTGKKLLEWLNEGKDVPPPIPPPPKEKVEIIKKMKLLFPELKNGGMINKIVEVTKLDPAKEENIREINARLTILVGERDQYQNDQ